MQHTQAGVRWVLSMCAALFSTCAIADIPSATNECISDLVETTPSSEFTALEGGAVVRHEATGLEWRRCAEGMFWTGVDCTGDWDSDAINTTWQGALEHADAVSGWRLPNIKELLSIVETCRTMPAVNQQVFPNAHATSIYYAGRYWSSSPAANDSGRAWGVSFRYGRVEYPNYRSSSGRVRLVRGGQ